MKFTFHSSLRSRLFLGLLPLIAMFLAMGLCAVALFSRLAATVDAHVAENYRSIVAVQSIDSLLTDMEQEFPNAGGGGKANASRLADYTRRMDENLASLSKRSPLPGERDLILKLISQYNDFLASLSATKGPNALAGSGMTIEVSGIRNLLDQIRGLNYHAILTTSQDIQKATRQVSQIVGIGLVLILAVSAYSFYWIGRSILRPIQSLTTATSELGDGKFEKPVPVVTDDELGGLAIAFNKMAALLQEYRRSTTAEIVRLHHTMEATLASFPDPIFVLNNKGGIELKNPAATALSESLQLDNQLPPRLQSIAQSALESRRDFLPHSFDEVVSYRWDGAEKFLLPRVLVMRDREGAMFGVAVVLYDVTRFRLLDAAKTNLVATVSHELKSPLTSVRMALHLLLEKTIGGLSPRQEQLIQAARDDSERLLNILNDLLDLARLDEGGADLRRENIAPVELLHSLREQMAGPASARGIKINCVVESQLPAVSVDRQRIDHVFTNLLSNAIKHSPSDSEIIMRAERAAGGAVEFSVIDQGPGIPEQYQSRIFDRFYRVPGQDKTGAGLGLPIAREITVAHGGRIGVKSSPGHGATFFVILNSAA